MRFSDNVHAACVICSLSCKTRNEYYSFRVREAARVTLYRAADSAFLSGYDAACGKAAAYIRAVMADDTPAEEKLEDIQRLVFGMSSCSYLAQKRYERMAEEGEVDEDGAF